MDTLLTDPAPNTLWVNRKTGGHYRVVAIALEATNAREGASVVVYRPEGAHDPQRFVRDRDEFLAKFAPQPEGDQPTSAFDGDLRAELDRVRAERDALAGRLNTPELVDFAAGTVSEAAHQRARWGSAHDAGKTPADWFWLVGYLAGKALHAQTAGNTDKALHHTISTAAALANWHGAILGTHGMRPGLAAEALPPGLSEPVSVDLTALRVAANEACVLAVSNRTAIGGAVNWTHLRCTEALRSVSDQGEVSYAVLISEASPEAATLQQSVAAELARRGFPDIDVITEW